jgi:hypothetical protein
MAISYSLDLATPSPAAQVAHELVAEAQEIGQFDAAVSPALVLDEGVPTARGMWVRVLQAKPQPWHPVIADLGFTPAVSVSFRMGKDTEIRDQQDDMVRLVSALLRHVPGDAVLHSGFESIWLLRRDGQFSVSEQADLWPPRRLAVLPQPYTRATHAFSEE